MDQIKVEAPKEEQIIYKFVCLCLSQKLENTNVKAKQFEILNRTLQDEVDKRTYELKVQNSELSLSFKKLENMHSESLILINKLASLDDELVKNTLLLFEGQSSEENRAGIQNGLKLIQKNLSLIKTLKREQDTIEGRNVLVAESNTKLRNMMKIALGGTGVKVEIAKSVEEVKTLLTSQSFSILFLSANMLEVADFVAQEKINIKIVLLTEEESKSYISKIKSYPFLSNIITTTEDDRNSNIKSISTTVKKMTTGDIFGLEKYLNWGVEVKEIDFTDSAERNNINEKVLSILADVGIKNSIRTRAQIVIEELLMNAIYDAPVDQQGTPLHNHKSRRERVILEDYQKGKIRFATDGLYLAISVEDPFGVFKKETIFQYLEGNYTGKEHPDLEAEGKGGAGKGLYLITENSDLVIYNIAPQTKTEVIVLFELDSQKDKRATSLHYFEM
jgi:CheY-like chemotaxis protein